MTSLPTGRFLALVFAAFALAAGCSSGGGDAASNTAVDDDPAGIRIVTPEAGAEIQGGDTVVLDVRTSEEFTEGHLEGAVMIDFYAPDFADQLAELDPDASYLLYCRSGSRSGQTTQIMSELGFTDVADVDGGILAWTDAGLPVIE